jgi:hypothetical protein
MKMTHLTILAAITAATPFAVHAAGENSPATGTNEAAHSWDSENMYWQKTYPSRPYYKADRNYDMYAPAYKYGMDVHSKYPGKSYDELSQDELNRGWVASRGTSTMNWDEAQQAARDSYNRMADSSTQRAYTTNPSTTTNKR